MRPFHPEQLAASSVLDFSEVLGRGSTDLGDSALNHDLGVRIFLPHFPVFGAETPLSGQSSGLTLDVDFCHL